MAWLGNNDPFSESFPEACLNSKQVATLLAFRDIRVTGMGPGQAVKQLTDTGILEVVVRWSKGLDDFGSGGYIWFNKDGEYIGALVWEGEKSSDEGPVRLYRWMPGVVRWHFDAHAEQVTYSRSERAVDAMRAFIKMHWDSHLTPQQMAESLTTPVD